MYGKIFESMYEGTLYGQWEAIVTMQQLIVLANADGIVDYTPPAIAGKTSIPLEIIEKGLKILSAPDPYSRTPGHDGVRIVLIDDHKPWGWLIVNHEKYTKMIKREDKRQADRERIANKRKSLKEQGCREVSQSVANVAHEDEDVDVDENIKTSLPEGLNADAWKDYLQHRKDLRVKKLTPKGETMAMNKLLPLPHDQQQAVVDTSISNGWTGLFPDRTTKPNKKLTYAEQLAEDMKHVDFD